MTQFRITVLIIILLAGTAFISVWPLPLHLNSGLPAPQGFSGRIQDNDPAMFCWNLWWINQWITGQSPLLQSSMIHHPFGMPLNRHTLSVANGILATPVFAVSGPVKTYNILIVFHALLTVFGAYILARHFKAGKPQSVIAAILITWWPARLVHAAIHLNLASTGWMLFSLVLLLRYCNVNTFGRMVSAALLVALTGASSWHLLLQLCMIVPVIVLANRNPESTIPKDLVRTTLAMTMGLMFLLPLIIPLFQTDPDIPAISTDEIRRYSIQPASLFIPGAGNPFFGRSVSTHYSSLPGNVVENTGFLGYAVLILAFVGLITGPVRNRILICSGLLFVLLSLGPDIQVFSWRIPLPFSVLSRIPFLNFSRTPGRFMIPAGVLLGLSCAITLGQTMCAKKRLALPVIALIIIEFMPGNIQIIRTGPMTEYDAVAHLESTGILPVPNDWSNQYYMLGQTLHKIPVTTGFSARLPQTVFHRIDGIPGLQNLSNPNTAYREMQTLTPAEWRRIRTLLNVDTVIFHSKFCLPEPLDAPERLSHLNPQIIFSEPETRFPDLIIDLNQFDHIQSSPECFFLDRWSGPENWGQSASDVYWGLYPSSLLRCTVLREPLLISFSALAARQKNALPVQTLIRYNNSIIHTFSLAPEHGWTHVSFQFDPSETVPSAGSDNSLSFRDLWFDYSSGSAPAALMEITGTKSPDRRSLAIAVRNVKIEPLSPDSSYNHDGASRSE